MDKRRHKRDTSQSEFNTPFPFQTNSPCGSFSSTSCPARDNVVQGGLQLRHTMQNMYSQHHLYISGQLQISDLRRGHMCSPDSELLLPNAFSAMDNGHLTPSQLATANLLPVQSVDPAMLLRSGYLIQIRWH